MGVWDVWLPWLSREHEELDARAKLLVLCLAELVTRRNAQAFPSLRALGERLGCSASAVRSAIRAAEQAGIVRRVARYASCTTGGVRQTSNRYELLKYPPRCAPKASAVQTFEVVEDGDDPNQLELSQGRAWKGRFVYVLPVRAAATCSEAKAASPQSQPEGMPAPSAALAPTVTSAVAPAAPVAASLPVELQTPEPPHLSTDAPPCSSQQGKEGLRVKQKANSTGARERAKALTPADASPQSAAAFLSEVLSPERARELKRRFGLNAYGSLLFALRRNVCQAHPQVADRALSRLLGAPNVQNPGAYFFRVFTDELEAFQLLPAPDAEDERLERERAEDEALRAHQQALQAELERVHGVDWEATERVRAELEQLLRTRRLRTAERARGDVREGEGAKLTAPARSTPAEASPPPRAPAPRPSAANAAGPSDAQGMAESARILAQLRGRSAA